MDRATSAYGLPPPDEWHFVAPIPAPHFERWLRISIDTARPPESFVVVEQHPWQSLPPGVESAGWTPLPEHGFAPRFRYKGQAVAWLMGLLYGAAWQTEFDPSKQPGGHA